MRECARRESARRWRYENGRCVKTGRRVETGGLELRAVEACEWEMRTRDHASFKAIHKAHTLAVSLKKDLHEELKTRSQSIKLIANGRRRGSDACSGLL